MESTSNLELLVRRIINCYENKDINIQNKFSIEDISKKFNNNPSLFYTLTKNEYVIQNDVKFLIKVKLNNVLDTKPIKISTNREENSKIINDIFEPSNIEKDLLVGDYDEDYNIVFNKYPLVSNHMLFIPKVFESQYTHITKKMFLSMIKFTFETESFCFFNGGASAGATQPRKHTQVVPKLSYDLDFGLLKILNENLFKNFEKKEDSIFWTLPNDKNQNEFKFIKEDELFFYITLNCFKRSHLFGICKLRAFNNQINNILNEAYYESYLSVLEQLELRKENDKLHTDYTMIISKEFIFITPRKTKLLEVKEGLVLNVNSLGFMLSLFCKDDNELENLKKLDLLNEVFERL